MAAQCGYTSPADMIEKHPAFFWENVEPYIGPALEHARRRLGPQVGAKGGERG